MRYYKKLEKHNIIDIVKKHNLENFTVEKFRKVVERYYQNMYYTYNLVNELQELVNENKLEVKYESVKIDMNKSYYSCYFKKPSQDKYGSVSKAVYNYSLTNERDKKLNKLFDV